MLEHEQLETIRSLVQLMTRTFDEIESWSELDDLDAEDLSMVTNSIDVARHEIKHALGRLEDR